MISVGTYLGQRYIYRLFCKKCVKNFFLLPYVIPYKLVFATPLYWKSP